MPVLSPRSLAALETCGGPLQILMKKAIGRTDFTIIIGHRTKEAQDLAFKTGHSKQSWPHSKHNSVPSLAVDIAPYPINWEDVDAFKRLSDIIKETWESLSEEEKGGWSLEWGGDWKSFKDLPHYQITK